MSNVKEKDCLETMASLSGEISEKIICTTYFVNVKSWFVIVNNKFSLPAAKRARIQW